VKIYVLATKTLTAGSLPGSKTLVFLGKTGVMAAKIIAVTIALAAYASSWYGLITWFGHVRLGTDGPAGVIIVMIIWAAFSVCMAACVYEELYL
jgi:hypothetical protein